MLRARLLGVLLLVLAACDTLVSDAPVEIRLMNASDQVMEEVVVGFPDEEVVYGDLEPGAATDYRTVDRAFRYAGIRTVVNGDTLGLTPIDYVGEKPLLGGKYTYRLDLFEGRSLTLELVRD